MSETVALPRRWVDLDTIHIGERLRSPDMARVTEIAKSITEIGLLNPPAVRFVKNMVIGGVEELNVPILIVGHHRILALQQIGKESVECDVYNVDPLRAELMEIAENLHRAELTALERAEQLARWIELTDAKRLKSDQDKPAQPAPVSKGGRGNESGINAASRELGIDRTSAQRSVKIAGLTQEAKSAAVDAGLDDNRSALLEAARETEPEKQVAVIRTRSQTRRATKAERESAKESMNAALEVARREAENRKAESKPVDEPADDVDADGYYLKDEPVDQWRRSVMTMAGYHISMPAVWTREFGDWTGFAATPDMIQIALEAALMWSNLAVDLKIRLAGDQQQAA